MRIRKIRLQHVGPYRAPAELDLDAIGPGLIVLAGPNGAGKSTAIECIPGCIHRYAPSRGPVSNLATARDAQIEIVGEHDGPFTARIDMDNVSGKSEAILLDGDGKAVAGPKVTSYDAAIRSRFPPLSVYLAAAFSAQTGEGTLLKMERADRRALFAKLLGLERLEQLAACARKHADLIEKEMVANRAALEAVCGSGIAVESLVSALTSARGDAALAAGAVRDAADRLRATAAERDRLTQAAAEYRRLEAAAQEARRRLDQATKVLFDLEVRAKDLEPVLSQAAEIRAESEALRVAMAEVTVLDAAAVAASAESKKAAERTGEAKKRCAETKARAGDLRAKLAALDAILLDAEAIRANADRLTAAAGDLERVRSDGEAAAKVEREAQEESSRLFLVAGLAHQAFRDAERAVDDAAKVQDQAVKAIESAEKSTSGAPCAGVLDDDARSACPALVGHFKTVVDAKQRMSEVAAGAQARLGARDAAKSKAGVAAAEAARADVEVQDAKIRAESLRTEYRRLRGEHAKLVAADRSEDLTRAEAEAGVLRAGLENAEATEREASGGADVAANAGVSAMYAEKDAWSRRNAVADKVAVMKPVGARLLELERAEAEAAEIRGRIGAARTAKDAADEESKRAWDAVPKFDAEALPAAERDAATADRTVGLVGASAQDADRQVARLEAQLEAAEAARSKAEALMARLVPLEHDIADFRFLARALGREGVQALEMDAAGPRVASLANDLLRSCWDGRFQVRFDTQTALASGKGMKEDFTVTVLDSKHGRETDGSDLSGGEKVVVSSAIGRAIGWFHRETSGTSFDQVFVDEATGELDEEARPQYVEMMRRLLKAGGLFQVVAVSHDLGIIGMADAVVHVHDGTLQVMTPEEWRKQGAET